MSFSPRDQELAHQKFVSLIESRWSEWEEAFGPVEGLLLEYMELDEQKERLSAVDEKYVWADVEYVEGSQPQELLPGLVTSWNGWAVVPKGRYVDPNGENFWIASSPWEENLSYEPVFKFAQCVCPFCEGEGEYEGGDCITCDGSGEWEVDV